MSPHSAAAPSATPISRREAIRRATLLLGVALSPALLERGLRAQAAGSAPGRSAALNPRQAATVAAVAERIIPRTDTPGAAEVGLPAFIDLMYGEYLPPEERAMFAAGLAEVEAQSAAAHGHSFPVLTPAQQDALLQPIAQRAQTQPRTFFHQMRELTLLGYFTSEPVGRNVLHYDPIPGRLDGCIPLAEVGDRAWTR